MPTDSACPSDRASEQAILEASHATKLFCRHGKSFANAQCMHRFSSSKCQITAFLVRRVGSLEMLTLSISGALTQSMAPLTLLLDTQVLVYLLLVRD